ncbi:unnamed protein product [Rhizoctonia solani]|uniref:F-box domain-containing protein n=1 Tax=Rhizoctonia solani TaxID=456999 RepID=A0A8H2WJC7_9AGAM|nr:unnamed protein product [Rhizoctonia solani]
MWPVCKEGCAIRPVLTSSYLLYNGQTTFLPHDRQTCATTNLNPLKCEDRAPAQLYQRWKKLRDQLLSTIENYVDACSALAAVASPIYRPSIESIFVNIDQELDHLAQAEAKLTSGRRILGMLRNMSSTLCLVNLLPDDILAYIFEVSTFSYARDTPNERNQYLSFPGVLASVCTRWRHIAVNTCSLWSYLDLVPTSNPSHKLYRRAQICLGRVKSAPLCIYIHQQDSSVKREEIMQLTGFLSPLMKQLGSLHLSADCHMIDLFEEILGCWIEFGHPGSTQSLTLRRPNPIFLMAHPGLGVQHDLALGQLQTRYCSKRLTNFLQPLRTLCLHNVCIGWDSVAHRGLSELHLEAIPEWAGLTICQLIEMLRASPKLGSLRISRVNLLDDFIERETVPEVIHLGSLECLDLLGANPTVLKRLLPLVIPGTKPLYMSMSLCEQDSIQTQVQSFLERSNLLALYLDTKFHTWAPALLGHIPHLRHLAIRSYHFSLDCFLKPSPEEVAPICVPLLESLYFIGCRVNLGSLRKEVVMRSKTLQSLKLWRSKLYADSISDIPDVGDGDPLDTLSDLIPHVQRSNEVDDYPVLGWSVCDELKGRNVCVRPDS